MARYIKSPIHYMGNKFKLLSKIEPLFPKTIDTFYDVFGGSGVVSLNASSTSVVYNELNPNIFKLFEMFRHYKASDINDYLDAQIDKFGLNKEGTDIRQNVVDDDIRNFYNEKYNIFREYYNKSERDIRDLFLLTFYSYCNTIRFNQQSEFNMPFGNRCFIEVDRQLVRDVCKLVENKSIKCVNGDALNLLQTTIFNVDDFIYLDPPYLNTTAIYNEKRAFGGWTYENDIELFEILDKLTEQGIRWGMSNTYSCKGKNNDHLIEWSNKYQMLHLNQEYSALGKGTSENDEVYIYNYDIQKECGVVNNNLLKYDFNIGCNNIIKSSRPKPVEKEQPKQHKLF